MSGQIDPRLLRYLLRMQFEINVLSSVAVEYPVLRSYQLLVAQATAPPAAQEGER